MLEYAGHVADEPRGYEALGTSPLNRFYQASDRWFFLAAPLMDAACLSTVDGLEDTAGLEGAELERALEATFAELPAAVWVERLLRAGASAHAVVPAAELMADPAVCAQGLSVTQSVEVVGEATMPGLSVRLSRTPMRLGEPPHRPGSDAAQILDELGIGDRLPGLARAWALQVEDLPPAW
jgi:crotonobetainyl-CoA:carnitine CoA-transferase CaiB-like acyl-CoA transferase